MENDFYMFKHLSPPYYSPGRVRQILLKILLQCVKLGCILFRIGLPRMTVFSRKYILWYRNAIILNVLHLVLELKSSRFTQYSVYQQATTTLFDEILEM